MSFNDDACHQARGGPLRLAEPFIACLLGPKPCTVFSSPSTSKGILLSSYFAKEKAAAQSDKGATPPGAVACPTPTFQRSPGGTFQSWNSIPLRRPLYFPQRGLPKAPGWIRGPFSVVRREVQPIRDSPDFGVTKDRDLCFRGRHRISDKLSGVRGVHPIQTCVGNFLELIQTRRFHSLPWSAEFPWLDHVLGHLVGQPQGGATGVVRTFGEGLDTPSPPLGPCQPMAVA